MGKLVLRKTILRNMIDRVWTALVFIGLWILLGMACSSAQVAEHHIFGLLSLF
jgi:threonine/homoserine efflux transporter RhtA